VVKGQSDYSQWYGDYGVWYPDAFSFDVTQTYKSFSYSPSVLSITGDDADTSTPIELAPNWNWIGYLPQMAWDVDTALGSVDFAHGDFLKTQTTSTTYYAGYGWYPGVTEGFVINPGDGLMLNVESSGTLTYPSGNPALSNVDHNELYSNNSDYAISDWNVNVHDYEFNGTVTSKVFVNGERMGSEGDKVAVFANGECRGVASAMKSPFEDDGYVFLLMVYGNTDSEQMVFSYFNANNNVVYDNIQTLDFYPDMIKGNAIESHMVVHNENMAGPESYKLGAAYPNPFNPTTNIEYSIVEAGYTSIVVFNLQGQMVTELVSDFRDIGEYEIQWNAFNLPSGVYFINMSINGFTSNQKVMLIK